MTSLFPSLSTPQAKQAALLKNASTCFHEKFLIELAHMNTSTHIFLLNLHTARGSNNHYFLVAISGKQKEQKIHLAAHPLDISIF
jgi:hypothetical protein